MANKKTPQQQLIEWIEVISHDPNPELVKKHDDGSLYLPISATQNLLDEIFLGQWSFEVLREQYGRKWGRGYGLMTVINPITGNSIARGGDAAIQLTGNMKLDSPRLEAFILLSCAKKFGKKFGRDLNRNKDDAPLPVITEQKVPVNEEKDRLQKLIEDCTNIDTLKTYHLVAGQYKLTPVYNKKLKQLQSPDKKQENEPTSY